MSSFTEYHKKWKEENGKGEDSQYKQRSMDEILESTDRYLANKFNNNENMWDKVQSVANNNLNNSNNMQKSSSNNQNRIQSIKKFENYIGAKSSAMQAVSNAIQGNNNNKYLPLTTQISNDNESKDINVMSKKGREELISSIKKQIGKSIGEKILEFSNSSGNYNKGNNIKVYRDNLGQIDRNKTALEMAKNKTKSTLQMLERRKAYAEAQKEMDEKLKDSWQYRNVQMQNPNATEEELLKITKEKNEKFSQNLIEWLADMEPLEREARIKGFTNDKKQEYNLKSRIQALETQREADKINQDIQNGKYGSSIGHVLKGVPEGGINALAKTIATMESISPVGREEFVDAVKLQSRKYQETTSKIDNKAVQTASGVSNTIGEMTPAILASLATSGAGTVSKVGGIVNAVNVGSSGYLDALNEDNSNKGQAGITGVLKGTASYGIEKITGGNFLSKGSLDDIAKQTISSNFSSETAKKVASKIYEFGGEVLEENLENQAGYVIDKVINNQNITAEQWANDFNETTKNTILTTAVLNLLGLGGNTYKEIVDMEKNTKAKEMIKEAEKIIQNENLKINADSIKEMELRNVLNQVSVKENNQVKSIVNNSSNFQFLENKLANGQQTGYNDVDLGEVKNVPIEDVLQLKTDGGYRDKQYMTKLRENIKKNGIDNPIELVRNKDGSIEIENGNHRLQIANELGLKEVPIKFVESWDSILGNIDKTENKVVERLEVYNDRNNGNSGETNIFDGGSKANEEYSSNNWNQFKNRGTTTGDDRIFNKIHGYNDRPSSIATFEQNFKKKQELGDTSSFNLQNNNFNLQQNNPNNPINPLTQQTTSQENKVAQNGNMEQIKVDSENFARQVDDYMAGKIRSNDLINVGKTSQILQSIGLPDNDIVLKQSKLKSIMQDSNNPNDKLHGIPVDTIKRIPEALSNPLNILKSSTNENSVVVITDLADKLERPIIASIEMDYNGRIGNVDFLSNRLTSAYGKNNYDRFMQAEIKKGNLLYDVDEGIIKELTQTRVQSPARLSSFEDTVDNVSSVNNSIAQNNNSVKNTITNNYAQSNGNNSITNNNLASNGKTVYNNTESKGDINGESQFANKQEEATSQSINERGMVRDVETMRGKKQGGNTTNIENSQRQNDGSRFYENNVSKEGQSIEQAYKDNESILKTMEYAKKNPYVAPSKEIQEVRKFAKELGVPLNIYSGEEGNIHIGLTDGKEVYLDINPKNISKEDGSTMNRFSHELLHFIKRDTNFKDTIRELQDRIISENPEVVDNFIEQKGYENTNITNEFRNALAEEGLADYSAKHISGYDIDYSLPEDITYTLNTTVDDAITELKLRNTNSKQEQTNTDSQLNKVESNTGSLGYKPDREGKQRKQYKSVMESDQVGEVGKQSAKSLLENDTYTPISNVDTLATANANINRNGADNTYIAFRNKINSNERITLQDIATGERLIQIFSQSGDIEKVNGLIQDVANSQENKVVQNGNMEQIQNRKQNIDYDNSNYFQTAKNYNLDTNNETVRGIYDVTSKRGIDVTWDNTVFTNSKQNAKWTIDNEGNRSVVLNPNANTDTALQSVMVHELTHDISGTKEYEKISSMVLDRLKSSSDYDNIMLDIAKAYENEYKNMSQEQFKSMIEQEAVADYLGENLGNQEFVNELVRTVDRTQIQKIMDWVKNKITSLKNIVTGNKELNYWNKIKENFERAYNQEYQGSNLSERYSIQTDNNGNQYVKVDTNQDIFEGKSIAEQTKAAQEYILNNFRENGLLKDSDNINVSRKTANEYTHPKKGLDNNTYSSKLKASTELDNLLEISQFIKSVPDDGRHIFAKDGWDYYETVFKVGDKTYSGLLNIANGKNGKLLYDITNIKERANNYSVKTVSVANSSITNSILPTQENVNRNTTNNYARGDKKYSQQTNGIWNQYLKDMSVNKGVRETLKEVRVPISKEKLQQRNLANNGQTVYNNTERKGDINERGEVRQSNRNVFEQSTNEINTEGQTTINAREGFEKRFREATRKRISEEEISENSKNNRKILKDVYDTDIFFIEDNLEFSGGADEKLNLINLTREMANSKDNNVVTGHELFEVIRNTREDIKNEYIEPLIDVVENDNNFNDVLKKYVDNCETKDKQLLLDNPRYIAKEILFDEAGFMFNEDEFKLGVNKQETDLIRFSDYLASNKSILQIGLSNIEKKARVKNETFIAPIREDISPIKANINGDNLANNEKTVYNNTESGGGINGRSQITNTEETINSDRHNKYERRRISEDRQGTIQRIYQEDNRREQGKTRDRADTRREKSSMGRENQNDAQTYYREFEQQARKNQLTNISKESQQVKQVAKGRYGKTLIHFDDNNTKFGGGLSKIDDTSILFGKNAVEEYGDSFLLGHEIGEDMLKYHSDKVEGKYNEFKDRIQNDANFTNVCFNYIMSIDKEIRGLYAKRPELVAKELVCDTLGFMQNDNELGNNLPHKHIQDVWINELDNNLIKEIKETLKKYHDEIYPQKQTNIRSQLNEVEANTGSLGYKPDIEGKQRKHYKSVMESDQVGEVGKQSAKSLLENNQKSVYNNVGSEGENNGTIQGFQRLSGQFDTSISKNETKQETRKYNKQEYSNWEQSIRPKEESNLTIEEKTIKDNIKNQYEKDIVFFDGENSQEYISGASLNDKRKIYIDKKTANDFGINKVINHEIMESDIRHNRELSNEIIKPSIDKIIEDKNFEKQKKIFWENQDGEIPSNFAIAKELLCDRFAEIKSGENLDYKNILSQETNMTIDYALENFHNQLYGKNINEQTNTRSQLNEVKANLNLNKFKKDNDIENDIITENKQQVPISESKQEEKVARILEKAPDKVEKSDRKWAIFKANILDKGIVFEELSRKTKNRDLQGKWDYTLSATARGQNAIGNARYEFNSKTKTKKQICKSLEEIRTEVGNNIEDFSNYMYHQLNIDRMTLEERFGGDTGLNYERKNTINNKPVFGNSVTADMSKDIVVKIEQKYPKFKEYAQDVYDFLDANQLELVRNGVISQESADYMKEIYPHYVPIGRVNYMGSAINVPLDTGKTGVNSPIKSAKGGSSDILPLFDTIAQRTLQTYRASARNNFGVELKNTLNSVASVEEVTVDNVVDTMGQSIEEQDLLQEGKKGTNPTFTVFENGKKITYEITKDMYDALKPVSDSSLLGKTIKPLNKISNFRRGVLTEYNPLFSITNALKDAQDVLINSQHSTKTYSKFPEAYAQILKKGYWYQEYIQNGGEQNSYFNANDSVFESDVKQSKAKNVLKMPLDKISSVNNVIELAPRLSEYIASREAGRSVETSMLDASRVTTNFKAGGDVTKFANRNGATFLNASVQGAMQAVRNVQEANMKGVKGWTVLACKTAVAGLPAVILNNFIWGDDEDYDELQDYVKDNYYCIAKYGDGKFLRIPKGRALATIQKVVSSADKYITDGKEINADNLTKDFWECLMFAKDNLAPNDPIDNNVVSPVTQVMTNRSWYGEDIVPSRLQDKPEAEQYDETTDSFSILLGKMLNFSPYKINYLLDQYGGGISDVVLPFMTKQAENNPIEDKFTTDSVMKSKYPGNFFEMADELKISANSSNATDEDKVKYKYISDIKDDLNELYTQKREIQNSNMSDKDKKVKLKEVQRQINEMARNGMNSLETLKTTNLTAKVGNSEYYKYNNKWTKLKDEEKEKNKNISLTSYADYKNKLYNLTKEKKNSGEITEEGQLKNKDKIGALLNSKCTEEEKEEVYKKYIGTQDKKIQLVDKLNFPLEEYLKYKQQDFNNDKDENGESVSGTGKQKVYDYLNGVAGSNLTDNHKKIICKMEGINEYDKDVVTYINNNISITAEEKKELLKCIGFKIDNEGYVITNTILPIRKYIK